jgi:hypothetical protein
VDSFKYLGRKIMTNGSVKEEVTETIRNAGNCYQLVKDMLWKCLRREKFACLRVTTCSYNLLKPGGTHMYL